MRLSVVATALVALIAARPAAGQDMFTVEAGVFGVATNFENGQYGIHDRSGFGGRAAVYVWRNTALEAEYSYTKTPAGRFGDLKYTPLVIRALHNTPLGEHVSFMIGAGYIRAAYDVGDLYDDGLQVTLGTRAGLPGSALLRANVFLDRFESGYAFSSRNDLVVNLGFQLGVSYAFGPFGGRAGAP
ncbi:MAG TPA: hypothetical protein VNA89_11615 [Gemmatimonadaceae bacterium]|nr:hypothetical protein [Gemmatimonadaceae bacterium]